MKKKGANNTYWGNLKEGIQSSLKGLQLSFRHLKNARHSRTPEYVSDPNYFKLQTGIVTLQYPHEKLPLPDIARYQLHNEMDDCIVCDKCAKICPVDCIEIEPIKATGIVGHASDGSPIRLYAAKFDIDMAKCCFCGLCTTVCPTECLTMTHEYDFSVFDIKQHNFEFGNLTPEQSQEKRELYEQFMAEKVAFKANTAKEIVTPTEEVETPKIAKPTFRPSFKPKVAPISEEVVVPKVEEEVSQVAKPAFKPTFKPKVNPVSEEVVTPKTEEVEPPTPPIPKFKPTFKPKVNQISEVVIVPKIGETEISKPARPTFKPTFKPKANPTSEEAIVPKIEDTEPPKPARPTFKPTFKPKTTPKPENEE